MSFVEHELLTLEFTPGFIGFMLFILSTYIILVLTYYVLRFSSFFPFICRGSFLVMTYVICIPVFYIYSCLTSFPYKTTTHLLMQVGGDAIIKFYIIWMIIWEIVRFHVFFLNLDIDECRYKNHFCSDICENSPGSYTCSCREGFTIYRDRKYCIGMFFILWYFTCNFDTQKKKNIQQGMKLIIVTKNKEIILFNLFCDSEYKIN